MSNDNKKMIIPPMNNFNISKQFIIDLLQNLKSNSSEDRRNGEQILSMINKDENLYKELLKIAVEQNDNISQALKIQSLYVLKSLIIQDINNSNKVKGLDYNLNNYNHLCDIYNFLKKEFLIYLSLGNYIKSIDNPIKDIILLLSDKFFPDDWNELNEFFIHFFEKKIENFISEKYLDISIYLMSLFYSILKIFNKKKSHHKFLKIRDNYLNSYIKYYKEIINFFNNNLNNFTDVNITSKYLQCLLINDKALCLLISISYNQSTFQRDQCLLLMIKLIIERTANLINQINNVSLNEIKDILKHNLYKNLKLINLLQSTNPILFCYELELYIEILFYLISNCKKYNENTTKIVIFSLTKIMNTNTYRETFEIEKPLTENIIENISHISETPKKKRNVRIQRSHLNLFLSPTKYRNFEKEIRSCNELFNKCFTAQKIQDLLLILIQKCPFIYEKENDDLEIEILANLEEDNINSDNFSTNIYTFQYLYKNILETIIINFTDISMNYIKKNLDYLYTNFLPTNPNVDFLLMDSFFNLINLIPELYKSGIIYITEMIDTTKYISYIYSFIHKSNIILKKYIITLSKWSVILISNEIIFEYINNLINFIQNYNNNNYILIQSCLCLKTILDSIDKMMLSNENINTIINRDLYSNLLKTKINWSNLLCLVSNLLSNILPTIKSSELIVSLVKFFTSLIKKCHYQNNGEILNSIKNSKLIEITSENKNEFTENVYIDMYKTLLITFPSSYEITEMSIFFIENSLKGKISLNMLNFLLYVVRCIDCIDENKMIICHFIQRYYKMFITNFSQDYTNILLCILEEIILFDVLKQNDLINIIDMINGRYNLTFETSKQIYLTIINNNLNRDFEFNTKLKLKCEDLCDSKTILLDVLNSVLLFIKHNLDNNIENYLNNILKILFTECKFSYETFEVNTYWLNSNFITSMFEIINRIALSNFEFFILCFNNFLKDNNLSPEFYFSNMMKVMIQISKIGVRKINILFISKMLELYDYNFLLQNSKIIFEICLQTVLIQLVKKHSKNNDSVMDSINAYENIKGIFQIKQCTIINISNRKKNLIENDPLLKIYNDIHLFFIEKIKNICKKVNKSEIDFLKESNLIYNKDAKKIFGLIQNE